MMNGFTSPVKFNNIFQGRTFQYPGYLEYPKALPHPDGGEVLAEGGTPLHKRQIIVNSKEEEAAVLSKLVAKPASGKGAA